jgi:hypothetical protein
VDRALYHRAVAGAEADKLPGTMDLGVVKAIIFHIGGGEGMAFGGSSAVSLRGVNGFH